MQRHNKPTSIKGNNYYRALRDRSVVNGWLIDSPSYKKKGKGGGYTKQKLPDWQAEVGEAAEATAAAETPVAAVATGESTSSTTLDAGSSTVSQSKSPGLGRRKKTCGDCKGCINKKGCDMRTAISISLPRPTYQATTTAAATSDTKDAADGIGANNAASAKADMMHALGLGLAPPLAAAEISASNRFSAGMAGVDGIDASTPPPVRPVRRAVKESQLLKLQQLQLEQEQRELEMQEERAAAAKAAASRSSRPSASLSSAPPPSSSSLSSSTVAFGVDERGRYSFSASGQKIRTVVLRSASSGPDAIREDIDFDGEERVFDSVLSAIAFLGVGKSKYYECAKLGLYE